jgi:PAS domain S-box-containing protein
MVKKSKHQLQTSRDIPVCLHTVWAHKDAVVHTDPVFNTLLQLLKTRFRVATVLLFMAQKGAAVIKMRVGPDPSDFYCTPALDLCGSQENALFVLEDVPGLDNDVVGSQAVRFYAGAPLVVKLGGSAEGMLCLIDTKPRGLSTAERLLFKSLANAISSMLLMPHNPVAAQAIVLSSQKGVLLLDDAQMVEAVNARFTSLTSFDVQDLLKTGVDDLLCLDRPASGALLISHALLAEVPARGMTRCHTKNGGTLPVEVFVLPLSDPRGRVVKTLLLIAPLFSGPLEDFLLSLRSTERNELLSLHIAGLWSLDNAGLIVKMSGAPVRHLNASNQETIAGKRLDEAEIFDPALTDWTAFYASIAEASVPDELECCVTHDGHSQWYSMVGFRQYDARGQAIGYHGSFRDITRRKLKEKALRKSEARQRLILKGTNDGAWDWDLETGEYYLSPRWWGMMGRDASAHVPAPEVWTQFIHPDDREAVTAAFRSAADDGRDAYQSEFRMLHQRGHYFPVLGRGHVLRNADGKAIRTSGTNQDLTEQRQAQAQIRLLESCVESLQDVVLITHASPRKSPGPIIAYVNPAFERFTGYTSAEAIGNTPRMLQGAQTCRRTLDRMAFAMSNWQGIRCELANYKKSGELFWIELEIIPVKTGGNEWYTHWIGVQRDITDRKKAEQALTVTTQRLNMAIEASGLGMWTSHFGRNEGFRDGHWNKMLGLPAIDTTTVARDWLKLTHPDDASSVLSEQNDAINAGEGIFEKEFRMRHADGRWLWIQSRGRVIERDAAGKPLMLAGTHLDVTAKVESRLRSERMNAQLLRCLEHLNVGVLLQSNGIVKFINSTLLRIFGYTKSEDIIGTTISAYVLPGDHEATAWRQQQLMAGAAVPPYWFNCIHMDGRVFKALTSSTVIEWEGERHILATVMPPSDIALLSEEIDKTRSHYESLLAAKIEKEQVAIAHELHDSLGSQLACISLQVSGIKLLAQEGKPQDAAIEQLLGNIKIASDITRDLAQGLVPVDDWPGAFGHALDKLCREFSTTEGLCCEFEMEGNFDSVNGQVGSHLYRITQEAIANALRHGGAQLIHVSLIRSGSDMALSIQDDGAGFEVRSVINENRQGLGLSSMYARARAVGAQITLQQVKPKGFCVSVNWTQQ